MGDARRAGMQQAKSAIAATATGTPMRIQCSAWSTRPCFARFRFPCKHRAWESRSDKIRPCAGSGTAQIVRRV